jgi:hypothetical protein
MEEPRQTAPAGSLRRRTSQTADTNSRVWGHGVNLKILQFRPTDAAQTDPAAARKKSNSLFINSLCSPSQSQ